MKITTLIQAAFLEAASQHKELHKDWIKISYSVGWQLPASKLIVSLQRAGELDMVLRCLEDERAANPQDQAVPFSLTYQTLLSELWVGQFYEFLRLLKARKCAPDHEDFKNLMHDLRLLRVVIDKGEIANDNKLKAPLLMQKQPLNNDESDYYEYAKDDPKKGHIMPTSISGRGAVAWQVIDIVSDQSYWVERRQLSERIHNIFNKPQQTDPTHNNQASNPV